MASMQLPGPSGQQTLRRKVPRGPIVLGLRARHGAQPSAAATAPVASRHGTIVDTIKNLRGCLFDIDGTLCNSEPLHFQVYQETLLEEGFNGGQPITHQFFMDRIAGRHNPEIAAELFPDRPLAWRTAWSDMREGRFRQLACKSLTSIKGLHRFTAWVSQRGLRRAAVTNAPRPNAEVMVHGLQLDRYFEALVIGDECMRGKPYPDPYMQGLIRLGLQHCPHQVLALEDSPAGIRAAVSAGLPVVGLASARPPQSLYDAGCALVVKDWDELMDFIVEHLD